MLPKARAIASWARQGGLARELDEYTKRYTWTAKGLRS